MQKMEDAFNEEVMKDMASDSFAWVGANTCDSLKSSLLDFSQKNRGKTYHWQDLEYT